MNPEHGVENGGRGFVHDEVRDHQLAVMKELATRYEVEGVELDFAAAPGGCPFCLNLDEAADHASLMTEFVGEVAEMVRGREGEPGQIGARIYPTEEMNRQCGLDVRTWLSEGW